MSSNGRIAPYRVQLDNGRVVFAPRDDNALIRPYVDLRFAIGQRVKCKTSHDEGARDVWKYGNIVDLNVRHGNGLCPYLIQLDQGVKIVAPRDSDNLIQAVGEANHEEESVPGSQADLGEIIEGDT